MSENNQEIDSTDLSEGNSDDDWEDIIEEEDIATDAKFSNKNIPKVSYPVRKTRYIAPLKYEEPKERKKKKNIGTWSEEEIDILYKTILTHGHTNFKAIAKALPHRSKLEYTTFLRRRSIVSRSMFESKDRQHNLQYWMEIIKTICSNSELSKSAECLDIAAVVNLLSIDGVVENHPLPSMANGLDFPALYRLLYQALVGHPLTSVNLASINFLKSLVSDIPKIDRNTLGQHTNYVKKLIDHITNAFGSVTSDVPELYDENTSVNSKPKVKSYSRKKEPLEQSSQEVAPVLNITVTQNKENAVIETNGNTSLLALPQNVSVGPPFTEKQMKALESKGYNPLQIPVTYLYGSELNLEMKFFRMAPLKKLKLKREVTM